MAVNIKKNFLYTSIYQILLIILPLVTLPYISRILGPTNIGKYSYSNSIAVYFSMFIMLGINNYGSRAIAISTDDKKNLSNVFWSIYSIQIICGIIVTIAYFIYIYLFSNDRVISLILYIYIFSACIDINWLFFGLEEFKFTTIRNMIVKVLMLISIFKFVNNENDIYVYAILCSLASLLSQILLWLRVFKFVNFINVKDLNLSKHIKPIFILFVPVIAVSIYKIMDKIMLGALSNELHVGYYESSEKIVTVPLVFVASLGTVMLPRMSSLYKNKDRDNNTIIKYLNKSFNLAMFLSSSISFGIMSMSEEIILVLLGEKYLECVPVLNILLLSCIFVSFANVLRTQYLIPSGNDNIYIISVCIGAIVNFIINILLIQSYYSIGAALGTLLAESVVCIFQIVLIHKKMNLKKFILNSIPYICAGLFMYISLKSIELIVSNILFIIIQKVIIGLVIYFIILIFFKMLIKSK